MGKRIIFTKKAPAHNVVGISSLAKGVGIEAIAMSEAGPRT